VPTHSIVAFHVTVQAQSCEWVIDAPHPAMFHVKQEAGNKLCR